jgi:hypothetical protein
LETGTYEPDILKVVGLGDPPAYGGKVEDGDFKKVLLVRDPWSRLVHYFKDALIKKRTCEFFIEDRHRMIDIRATPFGELVKLLSILNPLYLADPLKPQGQKVKHDYFDTIISLDKLEKELPEVMDQWGVPFKETLCARNLKRDMVQEEGECQVMMRGYMGKVRPNCFNQSSLPPVNCFYDRETWELVGDVYKDDLEVFSFLRLTNPFLTKVRDHPKMNDL